MNRFAFKRLYSDLTVRVKDEGKKNSSWLMGFLQGLGNRKLTGYQCAAFVDLLLVHPEEPELDILPAPEVPEIKRP
ncbi:MAG: hypothetical protein J6C07_09650 [Lachnospiraceae bacterium]|nr:hypothetical protein [Lachnospiraceae bacterium]